MYLLFANAGLNRQKALALGNGNKESELVKISRNQIYVPKTWDYNMVEKVPEYIKEEVSSKTTSSHSFRKQILPVNHFMEYALITGAFKVLPVANLSAATGN